MPSGRLMPESGDHNVSKCPTNARGGEMEDECECVHSSIPTRQGKARERPSTRLVTVPITRSARVRWEETEADIYIQVM